MATKRILLIFFTVLFGSLCLVDYGITYELDWVNKVPESLSRIEWVQLEDAYIHEVSIKEEDTAEKILNSISVKVLEHARAEKLTGEKLKKFKDRKYYLVRGVYYNLLTGDFYVYHYKDMLSVHHMSLGSEGVPVRIRALVLSLQNKPAKVFVDCSMAM